MDTAPGECEPHPVELEVALYILSGQMSTFVSKDKMPTGPLFGRSFAFYPCLDSWNPDPGVPVVPASSNQYRAPREISCPGLQRELPIPATRLQPSLSCPVSCQERRRLSLTGSPSLVFGANLQMAVSMFSISGHDAKTYTDSDFTVA